MEEAENGTKEEAKNRKKAITIFSNAEFWEQLFEKDSKNNKTGGKQLMALKEFHQKYQSTLPAELLFLDLKGWFKTHSNLKGKGMEKELVKMLQYMYTEFFKPCRVFFQPCVNNFNLINLFIF